MGLVSATEMLKKAKEGHYAVGQFNINNLEWTKSVLLTAEELKAPVILGVSEGAAKYMTGYTTVAAMVKAMVEALNIKIWRHLCDRLYRLVRKGTGNEIVCYWNARSGRTLEFFMFGI